MSWYGLGKSTGIKLSPFPKREEQSKNLKAPREPLTEYFRIPELLGVLPGQLLYARRAASLPFPEPTFTHKKVDWYAMSEVRKWWKEVDGANIAVSEHEECNKKYRLTRQQKIISQSLLSTTQ